VDQFLEELASAVGASYVEHLPAAAALRRSDPHLSVDELRLLPRAVDLARSAAR